jgi:hypothetical protein
MVDVSEIERKAELVKVSGIAIGTTLGGVQIASPADLELMSARLARGGPAVPPHVRDKPGTCFSICLQALEWRMPIMSVINKSYVVINRGVERIAYESQLLHAVVIRNAPLKGRLRHEIMGEGDERRCKVWGTFKGEKEPHVYISETLFKLREARGRNDRGEVKGSPLWEHQPEVQLFYSATRQWSRLFAPDVLLGAYSPEDPQYLEDARDPVLPPILSRLRERQKHDGERGFDLDRVRDTVIEHEPQESKHVENPEGRQRHPDPEGRGGGDDRGALGAEDEARRDGHGAPDQTLGGASADGQEAGADQGSEGGEQGEEATRRKGRKRSK